MNRVLELFNKTNQFNTTGIRYTLDNCERLFSDGRLLLVLWAEDRFTQYGLIVGLQLTREQLDYNKKLDR